MKRTIILQQEDSGLWLIQEDGRMFAGTQEDIFWITSGLIETPPRRTHAAALASRHEIRHEGAKSAVDTIVAYLEGVAPSIVDLLKQKGIA